MKFEDGIRLSIKNFLAGDMPKELGGLKEEGLTYTPEWFDHFEESFKNKEVDLEDNAPKKKSKKKKDAKDTASDLKGLGYAD